MTLPTTMVDYLTLLGVAGFVSLLAVVLPTRWGWWGFPLVVIGLIAAGLVWMFGMMPNMYALGGGMVIHTNFPFHLALAAGIFWLTLSMKRRRQNAR